MKNELVEITESHLKDYLDAFNLTSQLDKKQTEMFIKIAKAYQLNPFKREIYCIPYGNKVSIITGYEVYIKRAERTGMLKGWRVYTEGKLKENNLKAIVEIYRKDWDHPFTHEVYHFEYNQNNAIWKSKPVTMIKKVAIAQAFRLAFPDELGGLPYTSEENDNYENVIEEIKEDKSDAEKVIDKIFTDEEE